MIKFIKELINKSTYDVIFIGRTVIVLREYKTLRIGTKYRIDRWWR
ncbi:MAG: hypothetical protein IE909_09810 [Campylobacterales bacterium]|nr:hypothetical protein [Campylobacterales bacterium]